MLNPRNPPFTSSSFGIVPPPPLLCGHHMCVVPEETMETSQIVADKPASAFSLSDSLTGSRLYEGEDVIKWIGDFTGLIHN